MTLSCLGSLRCAQHGLRVTRDFHLQAFASTAAPTIVPPVNLLHADFPPGKGLAEIDRARSMQTLPQRECLER